MENEQRSPGTSLVAEPRRRRSPVLRRVLIASVAGCAMVGGLLWLLPEEPRPAPPPAPGPKAQALTAVTAGVPAALPDLAALIGDREARVRVHPQDARSWAVLGVAYVEQGRRTGDALYYPKADDALHTSLKVRAKGNDASAVALDGLAALANERRDFRAARTWGEAAVKAAPKRWTTYPLLIDAYTGLGDYKATRRTLEKLQELHSGPAVMARAAEVYRDRGWREDAAAQLADAAARATAPAEQAAWWQRSGQLAWERGDREVALRHFEAAVRIDPDQREALAGEGRALAALGRTSEALNAYQVALAKQPSPQYALELGELYESLGLTQAARVQYDTLRTLVTRDAAGGVDDELVLGMFEADHGDARDAVRRLRGEWARQPGIPVADALGWALHRAGQDAEALKFASAATDKVHGGGVRDALYAFHRGMIERDLDKTASARRHLQEALQINPYFSPLRVPAAQQALAALGEPPAEPLPTDKEAQDKEPQEKAG
ncbi:tetratricopeptide repeat protein [Streptomyces sp. NBC_01622]|uniref:tetratricopeptide repeat protein n=1 Tax=Streptomyces sp. NBC_01622 TaxID=2975903 RepID=UPI00386E8A44|nr:tetratricopeptide repeat protein [Streptomyces sp. NBC_01622]